MNEKRLLIISNECFSWENANGRTLMNFLMTYPKEKLAQFYIHGNPEFDFCELYYNVSDNDVLVSVKKIFTYKKSGLVKKVDEKDMSTNKSYSRIKVKKNCRTLYFRYLLWSTYLWWNKHFDQFLIKFNPEVVLLQAGDAPFMYDIARKISKKFNIPLLMYNSENYVLKEKMYNYSSKKSLWHFALKKTLEKKYKKFMQSVDFCFYATEYLERAYQKKYSHSDKSTYLYISTEIQRCPENFLENEGFSIVYCGNLGVGRVSSLCSVAEVLKEINAKLIVYGKFASDDDEKLLCSYDCVSYNGTVAYSEIPNILYKSSMVIHCENSSRLEDLKYAFSTKIADSLACGKPFLVFASREYPFVQYLEKYNAAFVAETKEELKSILLKCIENETYKRKNIENAIALVKENHNIISNSEKFLNIVNKW